MRHNCVAAFSGSKRNARELARKRPRLITLRVRVRRIDSQINLLYSPRVLLLLPCAQCKRFVVPTIARGKKAYGNLNELIRTLPVFRKRGTTLSSLFFTRRLTSGRGPSFPSLSSMQITRLSRRFLRSRRGIGKQKRALARRTSAESAKRVFIRGTFSHFCVAADSSDLGLAESPTDKGTYEESHDAER